MLYETAGSQLSLHQITRPCGDHSDLSKYSKPLYKGVCAGASQAQGGYERDSFFQPLAGGDFGLDEEELQEPAPLNGR